MKRIAIILFTVFYAGLSFGVDLNLHYCGGQLAAISVALKAPSCCCDAAKNMSDCCEDASLTIQMDVDQVNTVNPTFDDIEYHCLACAKTMEYSTVIAPIKKEIPNLQPNPPPVDSQLRRIQMGSLTFYG